MIGLFKQPWYKRGRSLPHVTARNEWYQAFPLAFSPWIKAGVGRTGNEGTLPKRHDSQWKKHERYTSLRDHVKA